ncbi:hypothetical protein SGCZBJ_01930 [Caulobacter zeae]|uniref:Histidine kinase domain-containing protein n=1 Tax=Caulobacter zeae TaxID=2055137 RepID=A0A2N5DRH0_9CAUL|nr:sensor histidine kinase [Caulobacter zeae]PLR28634.1 hypothetical protein SGCZBJ_01930 [Caulobacter zeae]
MTSNVEVERNVPAKGSPCDSCDQIREADHRIANHLALLAGYVRLKALELSRAGKQVDAATAHMMLAAVGVQLDLIASLHRGFLNAPPDAAVQLPSRLKQLCAAVGGALGQGRLRVDVLPDYPMAPERVAPLTQAVAEALINAVKHGVRHGQAPEIQLRAARTSDGGLVVEVADRGPGLPSEQAEGGTGMKLMRALCAQIGATLTFASQPAGLVVRIMLPGGTMKTPH